MSKLLLLLSLLILSFFLRIYYNNQLAIDQRHNYPYQYKQALSYAIGGINLSNIKKGTKERKDIELFLHSKKNILELETLKKNIPNNTVNINDILNKNYLGTFKYYVAAIIWKYLGVSWDILFYFYSFLSTLIGLGLFFIAKKITSSYLGGLFSLAVYTFAAPELYGGVWSLRDASPVWFFGLTLIFYYLFTGIYKNKYLNLLSYYLLGIVTLLGIGWRSDALLFFPVILMYLIVTLREKYKIKQLSIRTVFLYILLFLLGSYSILVLNNRLQAKTNPFGFMHIALYAEDARSRIGEFENNFEYRVSDTVTKIRVQQYQKKTYPNEEVVPYMKDKYGYYCLELYIKAFQHDVYQWVRSYPKYFYEKFICFDTRMDNIRKSRYSFGSRFTLKQNKIISNIWKVSVCLAIFGGLIMLYVAKYRKHVLFLLLFVFYYSIVYWSIFPSVKHIMIMSIPISLLAGFFIYFLFSVISNKIYRFEVQKALIKIKNIKLVIFVFFGIVSLYYITLLLANLYSSSIKNDYIHKINNIAKEANDITKKINLSTNIIYLDLVSYEQVGLLIDFYSIKEKGKVVVQKNIGLHTRNGQLTPTQYIYKYIGPSQEHKFFTVCSKMEYSNNVKIIFSKDVKVKSIKLIPLNKWNGIQYTTIYNNGTMNSAGAKYIGDLK